MIRAGYRLLGLQTYFTAGEKEVRAWTVRVGATAPQAAGVIHTDFEKGFIRAEVIAYDDYIANKGEQGAKEVGKLRLEGKEYIVQRRRRHALPIQRLSPGVSTRGPSRQLAAHRRPRLPDSRRRDARESIAGSRYSARSRTRPVRRSAP